MALATGLLLWGVPSRSWGQSVAGVPLPSSTGNSQALPGKSGSDPSTMKQTAVVPVPTPSTTWTPAGLSVITPATHGPAAQRIYRQMTTSPSPSPPTFCFQPGIGWIRRAPATQETGRPAWQTIPLSVMAPVMAARRLPRPADSNDCATSASATPTLPLAGQENFTPARPDQESTTAGGEGLGNALPSAAQSASTNAHSPGVPSIEMEIDPETGEPVYLSSEGATAGLVSLRTSYSPDAGLSLAIPPPEHAIVRTRESEYLLRNPGLSSSDLSVIQHDVENQSTVPPIASFTPGVSRTSSLSGSAGSMGRVAADSAKSNRSAFAGYRSQPDEIRPASDREPAQDISPATMRSYRRLRATCTKLKDAEEEQPGGILGEADSARGSVSTKQAEELTRLRRTCTNFSRMSRKSVLKRLEKHQPSP